MSSELNLYFVDEKFNISEGHIRVFRDFKDEVETLLKVCNNYCNLSGIILAVPSSLKLCISTSKNLSNHKFTITSEHFKFFKLYEGMVIELSSSKSKIRLKVSNDLHLIRDS